MVRLAAIAIALCALATPAAATQAPIGQGTLVFASTRALNYGAADLIALDERGRRRNLTQSSGISDSDADLSPDGSRVVFTRQEAESVDLFTIAPSGRGLRRLTETPDTTETAAVYSPSGDAIAYVRQAPSGTAELWILDRAGERLVASTGGSLSTVTWSPDGHRLAFVDLSASAIFVVDSDAGGLRRLATDSGSFARPPLVWLRSGLVHGLPAPNARVALERIDPETGASQPVANPCAGEVPSYSTDRRFVACGQNDIRTVAGKRIRALDLDARNESTHIGRITLGPQARPLVYSALVDERAADIWLLGSRLRRLTSGPGEDHSPALSPNGRRVAFVRGRYQERRGEGDLLVVPARGGAARPLFGRRKAAYPDWSPEGRRLAYGHQGHIWIASLTTRRAHRLTRGHQPAWSPNGRAVAFVRQDGERYSLRTIGVDGKAERTLLTSDGPLRDVSWSPDGRSLAYATDGTVSVLRVADRTTRALVTETDNPLSSPTWSPNGRRIAYAAGWDNGIPYPWQAPDAHFLEVWTVDVASGSRTPLVRSPGFNYAPDWR